MKINFFNPRSIILFVCLLQGVIFAALLFLRARRRKSRSDLWLGLLLVVMCSGLITAFIGFAQVYNAFRWLTFFPFELVFALTPCVYFYVCSLTDQTWKFRPRHLLHFLPTGIYLVYRLFLFSHDLTFKDWYDDHVNLRYAQPAQNILLFLWNVSYLYLSVKLYYRYRDWLNHNFSSTELVKFRWLRNFLFLFGGWIVVSAAFEFIDSFVVKLSYPQIFYSEVILAILVYYLAVAGYLFPATIRANPEQVRDEQAETAPTVSAGATSAERKKDVVPPDKLGTLKLKVEQFMVRDRLFLEPDLSLTDLARQLGMNTTALSFVINNGFEKNFNDFVNGYRIEEFKRRRAEGDGDRPLLATAFDCGFNSKATFNRAFKKITGFAPSQFTP